MRTRRAASTIAATSLAMSCGAFGSTSSRDAPAASPDTAAETTLARGESGASELVVSGGDLFWTIGRASTGAIRSCSIAACEPRSLATSQDSPHALVVDGDHVLWAVLDEIRRTNHSSSQDPVTVSAGSGDGSEITAFGRKGLRVFYAARSNVWRCDFDPSTASCTSRSSMANGADSPLGPLTIDPEARVWSASAESLYTVSASDEMLKRTALPGARRLLATETTVFALTDGRSVLAFPTTAPDGQPPKTIVAGDASAIALDDTHLFVAHDDGHLDRFALYPSLGAPERLPPPLAGVKALAVHDRLLAALADGRIVSVPKAP